MPYYIYSAPNMDNKSVTFFSLGSLIFTPHMMKLVCLKLQEY